MSRRSKKVKPEKVGGFAYYLSLFSLLLLSFSNISALLGDSSVLTPAQGVNFLILAAVLCSGVILTRWLAPERVLTFIHEIKHAVLSGLAGNRWKGLKVDRSSGHFEYSYTKETAHLNALIALAPYFLPLLTIPATLLSIAICGGNHPLMIGMIGFAFGCDLYMNFRDISPQQTDFSALRGGFGLGFLYVCAANIFLTSTLIAWTLRHTAGLQFLVFHFWHLIEKSVALVR